MLSVCTKKNFKIIRSVEWSDFLLGPNHLLIFSNGKRAKYGVD